MCKIQNCGCNTSTNPVICMSYTENPSCEDRSLTSSNTTDPTGYSGVTMITPEVNQISAYTEHLEFVNSPEPLSGIKKHTVLRIAQSFIDGITGLISNFVGKNLGTGSKIYKGPKIEGENVIQEFRTLKNSESVEFQEGTDDIIAVVNEEWLQQQFPAIPTINYPVEDGESSGSGVSLYKGLFSKKIRIANLKTDNLTIIEDIDGNVKINYPESGSSSSDSYFVDETYIPTPTSQPDGSRSRPFLTLDDAINARIGEGGTRLNPKGSKGMIILLSDVTSSVNPTVNSTIFKIEGGKKYTYTGTNEYIFDFEPLFNEAKIPGGPLSQFISYTIQGNGTISRRTGFGHVRIKNDSTYPNASSIDNMVLISISAEGNGLFFKENEAIDYEQLYNKKGQPIIHVGNLVRGKKIVPTVPMFNLIGSSKRYWSLEINGTSVTIMTYSQVAIRSVLGGSLYEHTDSKITIDQDSSLIGYDTIEEVNIGNTTEKEFYFKPYNTKNLIECTGGGSIQFDNLSFRPDDPLYHNSNSIFKLEGGSQINVVKSLLPVRHKGAINFIEYSGSNNTLILNNAQVISTYRNFIKGDGINGLTFIFKNSTANDIAIMYNQATFSRFTTDYTISSIAGRYLMTHISGIYPDNATARPILGNNVVYRTSDGTLKITY